VCCVDQQYSGQRKEREYGGILAMAAETACIAAHHLRRYCQLGEAFLSVGRDVFVSWAGRTDHLSPQLAGGAPLSDIIHQHHRQVPHRVQCRGVMWTPAQTFPPSTFRDKNRRDIGKSQSKWTAS
jgi:hypothetical protein